MMMSSYMAGPSCQVHLPDAIESGAFGRVSGFWRDGELLLLQISSYIRTEGEQVSARQRLEDRLARTPGPQTYVVEKLNEHTADQAAAEVVERDGMLWLHAYFVWPHLAVYASISGPAEEVHDEDSWARSALKSLALYVQ